MKTTRLRNQSDRRDVKHTRPTDAELCYIPGDPPGPAIPRTPGTPEEPSSVQDLIDEGLLAAGMIAFMAAAGCLLLAVMAQWARGAA